MIPSFPDYAYQAKTISTERRNEIIEIAESLAEDSAYDIEDKRQIYEALMDLLNVASLGVCREHEALQ